MRRPVCLILVSYFRLPSGLFGVFTSHVSLPANSAFLRRTDVWRAAPCIALACDLSDKVVVPPRTSLNKLSRRRPRAPPLMRYNFSSAKRENIRSAVMRNGETELVP